ncbi:MAG: DUF4910 domain-containing protein, partial [Candidatus Bathyarchaeota archaeon]
HYKGRDVRGKFVLAKGKAKSVQEQAVSKYGAIGVITDNLTYEIKDVRESIDLPDAHAYQSIWPTAEELDKVTFGFSLSKRQGNRLRALLDGKKSVKLKALVRTKLFSSTLDIVTGTIKGKSNEEIVLIAHLCHPKPSANDNASGSGLLLEIARTIKALINSKRISRPQRTVRFLWVPEHFGTIAYLYHHEDLASRFIAGINLDMVGQDQELCKSTLNLDKTPDSVPSYLNDFILSLFERSRETFDPATTFGSSSTFRYSANPFSGGSDHAEFNASTFSVPCVMLIQWPDLYYHSSMDSIDKVSEDSLERVGWIATVATLTLADARIDDALLLAKLTRQGGMARLQHASQEAISNVSQARRNLSSKRLSKELTRIIMDFRNKIEHIVWREKKAMGSVKELETSAELEKLLKNYVADIESLGNLEITRFDEVLTSLTETAGVTIKPRAKDSKEIKKAKNLIPVRLFKGAFDLNALKRALGEAGYAWYEKAIKKDKDFRKKLFEILNFMNGKWTVYEITKAVSAEYSETSIKHTLRILDDLKKTKFISFK